MGTQEERMRYLCTWMLFKQTNPRASKDALTKLGVIMVKPRMVAQPSAKKTKTHKVKVSMAEKVIIDNHTKQEQERFNLKRLLNDERYKESKDWRCSDLVGRVEWLISMYESKNAEIKLLEESVNSLMSSSGKSEKQKPPVEGVEHPTYGIGIVFSSCPAKEKVYYTPQARQTLIDWCVSSGMKYYLFDLPDFKVGDKVLYCHNETAQVCNITDICRLPDDRLVIELNVPYAKKTVFPSFIRKLTVSDGGKSSTTPKVKTETKISNKVESKKVEKIIYTKGLHLYYPSEEGLSLIWSPVFTDEKSRDHWLQTEAGKRWTRDLTVVPVDLPGLKISDNVIYNDTVYEVVGIKTLENRETCCYCLEAATATIRRLGSKEELVVNLGKLLTKAQDSKTCCDTPSITNTGSSPECPRYTRGLVIKMNGWIYREHAFINAEECHAFIAESISMFKDKSLSWEEIELPGVTIGDIVHDTNAVYRVKSIRSNLCYYKDQPSVVLEDLSNPDQTIGLRVSRIRYNQVTNKLFIS